MRWSCPHCNSLLALPEDRVEGGWSFVRCYQCGGFSLVRRSDQKAMKVNQPPEKENVLLPTSPDSVMMSRAAQNHMDQIQLAAKKAQGLKEVAHSINDMTVDLNQYAHSHGAKRKKPFREKLLPIAIGAAGALAIFSGTFLFLEGQALWKKARTNQPVVEQTDSIRKESAKPKGNVQSFLVDEISRNAAAPLRLPQIKPEEKLPIPKKPKIIYRTKTKFRPISLSVNAKAVNLRSGPGLDFRVLKKVTPKNELYLRGWSKNWFVVSLKRSPKKRYWIRNDLVNSIPKN